LTETEPHAPRAFRCDVRPERDVVIVAPVGELDLATVPALEAQLRELRDAGFTHLAVDLRGLDALDSSALRLLVRWTVAAKEAPPRRFSVIPGAGAIRRVLDVCAADGRIDLVSAAQLLA
jgi:anti-anti-sigma factor